ncbi:MAG: translesion DNA synthesis-associated protein ImuA [Halieaceae bacterium]
MNIAFHNPAAGASMAGMDAIEQVMQRNDTWRGRDSKQARSELGTGYRQLDEQLYDNGWPLGNTIELLSDSNGLGAMGLFLPAMEQLSAQGRWQAFIAPPYIPYAPLLAARGIDTQQVLLVHPQNRQDLLWSIEQALRSSTCSAVFAWMGAADYSYSELRKLQLAANNSDALSVLFRPRQAAHNHAPASLRLEMNAYRQVHILKQRGGNQYVDVHLGEDNDLPGQPQIWELPAYPAGQALQAPALGA